MIRNLPRALLPCILLLPGCSLFQQPEPALCPAAPEVVCPVCKSQQCPDAEVVQAAIPEPPRTAGELNLPIVGAVEWATVEPGNLRMQARIDTGAETSSIHAEDIRLVERDGKRYVHFKLLNPDTGESVEMEERFKRRVLIKQYDREHERRYVVRLWITLGDSEARVEVSLSDRDVFEYPLLIGRNFLTDVVIVDVSRRHVLGQ